MNNYFVGYRCSNCRHEFLASVEKGKPAPKWPNCPVCEMNATLQKVLSTDVKNWSHLYHIENEELVV